MPMSADRHTNRYSGSRTTCRSELDEVWMDAELPEYRSHAAGRNGDVVFAGPVNKLCPEKYPYADRHHI